RKAMAVNRIAFLDSRKQAFVIVDLEVRMDASLHENSRPAESKRFLDFLEYDVIGKNISFSIAFDAIERTESAEFFADIGVVDIPVDDVADNVIRMPMLTDLIGGVS